MRKNREGTELRYKHSHAVVAHRLGGTEAPENTLSALKHGHAQWYKVSVDILLLIDLMKHVLSPTGSNLTFHA